MEYVERNRYILKETEVALKGVHNNKHTPAVCSQIEYTQMLVQESQFLVNM